MAEFALRRAFDREGLGQEVSVDSAGISDEELGNPVDPRARRLLERERIEPDGHSAQSIDPTWFGTHDLLLAMDVPHARGMARMAPDGPGRDKIRMFRSFDPSVADRGQRQQGIVDPWYGDASGFEDTWKMITAAVPGIVDYVRTQLDTPRSTTTGA